MKIIYSLISIILIISICNAIKFKNPNNDAKSLWVNFLPYDENCEKPVAGMGFGSLGAGPCSLNYTAETSGSQWTFFVDDETNYANLTTFQDEYCSVPGPTKVFKVGQCAQYDNLQNTNYLVTVTTEPQIPKGVYLIYNKDEFCMDYQNYWFYTPGTEIKNFDGNQTMTLTCKHGVAYTTQCVTESNCLTLKSSTTCGFLTGYYADIYCT
ncbi:hypothetical protein ACTFIR_005617 [Dictyostelium discoideum]